jgi:hypothetical protein
MHMMRKRAELLAHSPNTNSQYNLPETGKNLRYAFNRQGIAERFEHPSTQRGIGLDLNLIGYYDEQLSKIEWRINRLAKEVDYHSLMILKSVPGIGHILSLFILDEILDSQRFPRVQEFIFYCRLDRHEDNANKF